MIAGRADDVGRVLLVWDLATKAALSTLTAAFLFLGAAPAAQAQEVSISAVERASLSRAKGKDSSPLFVYEIADKDYIKKRITGIVEGWHKNVLTAVDEW